MTPARHLRAAALLCAAMLLLAACGSSSGGSGGSSDGDGDADATIEDALYVDAEELPEPAELEAGTADAVNRVATDELAAALTAAGNVVKDGDVLVFDVAGADGSLVVFPGIGEDSTVLGGDDQELGSIIAILEGLSVPVGQLALMLDTGIPGTSMTMAMSTETLQAMADAEAAGTDFDTSTAIKLYATRDGAPLDEAGVTALMEEVDQ